MTVWIVTKFRKDEYAEEWRESIVYVTSSLEKGRDWISRQPRPSGFENFWFEIGEWTVS